MDIIRTPPAMNAWAKEMIARGQSIALVPTMGFFHHGHLALMNRASEEADHVVVSLFVNPIQFGPGEDLEKYPRNFEHDAELAQKNGAAVLFAPEAETIYPEGFQTTITVDQVSQGLCGGRRPGHFKGVATVVAKLFNLVRPQVAVFGEKDFQQLAVIRRMVADLAWDIRVIGHPIVREPDGLAMSSRNSYLSATERKNATCLYRAIEKARDLVRGGEKECSFLRSVLFREISSINGVEAEYITFVDAQDLTEQTMVNRASRLVLAVKVGRTRLIDNGSLFSGDT